MKKPNSNQWVEIMGAGMVHPKVLQAVGLNPEEWTGFAFGCGIDRLAMMKYGFDDVRALYQDDLRFLEQF
jgi:phenylalanyl-tRNA synthetase alpha chain